MTYHRIWTNPPEGPGVKRELHRIVRNQYGDIVLILDGGDLWQFTPHKADTETPIVDRVSQIGYSRFVTGPLTGQIAPIVILHLKNPKEIINGNLRIIRPAAIPAPKHSKRTTNAGRHAQKENAKKRAYIRKEDRPAVKEFFKKHARGATNQARYKQVCDWLNGTIKKKIDGTTYPPPPIVDEIIKPWVVMDVVTGK